MLSWRLCWSPWGVNHLCSPLSDRLACTPLSSFLLRPGPLAASLLCLFSFYSNSQHLHRTAGSEDVCLPPCADPSASRASSSSTWPGKAAAWTTVLLAEAHPKWYDPHWGLETLSWTMPPKLTFPVLTCSDSSKSLRFSTPFLAFPFVTQNLPSLPCHLIIFPIVRNGLSSWVRKLGVSHLLSSFPSPLFSASSIPPHVDPNHVTQDTVLKFCLWPPLPGSPTASTEAWLPPLPATCCRTSLPLGAALPPAPPKLSPHAARGTFQSCKPDRVTALVKPSDSSSVNLRRSPLELPLSLPVCPPFPGFLAAHPSTTPSSSPVGALLTQKKPNFPTASSSSAGCCVISSLERPSVGTPCKPPCPDHSLDILLITIWGPYVLLFIII